HVTGPASIDSALAIAPQVDGLLLDSGNPDLLVKELGGTGRSHDWEISRRIVELVDVPVYLAGGLNPGNVSEAIQTVQPFGVDVCSGVRSGNSLDMEKLASFIAAVKSAST
ncbi:MAG: phosphoribosylanthranilate isomerase, partial [Candidatus Marinimicrobia bacterium]|nr:phosphoribosylanthranilate isomerase [Candidatus Neomarinimicrobiota bacterium]